MSFTRLTTGITSKYYKEDKSLSTIKMETEMKNKKDMAINIVIPHNLYVKMSLIAAMHNNNSVRAETVAAVERYVASHNLFDDLKSLLDKNNAEDAKQKKKP